MAFDPYHKWLGIPLDQQPASHYRLLAIEEFESDADVIETAAERQTLLLRTFQTGPDSELAEQLLNEVAAARVCLLRPTSKVEYDASLRDAVAEAEPPPAVFPSENEQLSGGLSEIISELPAPNRDSIMEEEHSHQPLKSPRPLALPIAHSRQKSHFDSYLVPIVVGGLLLIPLVVVMWWFIGRGGSDEVVQSKTPSTQQGPNITAAEKAAAAKAAADKRAAAEKLAAEKAAAEKAAAEKALKERSHDPEPKKEPSKSYDSLDNYVALYALVIPGVAGDNYSRILNELELQKYKANYTGPRTGIHTEKLGYASLKQQSGLVPLYQYRTRTQKRLLYKTYPDIRNSHEQERLLGWVGKRDLNNPSGMVPIYTLRNSRTDNRRFTSDPAVLEIRLKKGDKKERILAYVFDKNLPGSSDPPRN